MKDNIIGRCLTCDGQFGNHSETCLAVREAPKVPECFDNTSCAPADCSTCSVFKTCSRPNKMLWMSQARRILEVLYNLPKEVPITEDEAARVIKAFNDAKLEVLGDEGDN